ncbi:unnamed protein product [Colias eurytheme]|nr:unnamed protein product [Colias eurytheme]
MRPNVDTLAYRLHTVCPAALPVSTDFHSRILIDIHKNYLSTRYDTWSIALKRSDSKVKVEVEQRCRKRRRGRWAGGAGPPQGDVRARGHAADSLSSSHEHRHASERKLAAASERVSRVERRRAAPTHCTRADRDLINILLYFDIGDLLLAC